MTSPSPPQLLHQPADNNGYDSPLPPHWEARRTEDGRIFYVLSGGAVLMCVSLPFTCG